MSRAKTIVTAALAALAVAVVGGLMTDIGPWYRALEKPDWQPPDWLFGPVWTLIYALTALAVLLAWWRSETTVQRQNLLLATALNALLNVGWSLLFFRMQRPDWALGEVVFLWASVALLMWVCARRAKAAAWLLLPYLAWVTFAGVLNAEIVRLNGPFGGG
ncbi:MAG: TspO/MBR family protein [Xanthomonadales bacterium]|nr:TspO/MBR family protein [Xanthomonadales bacterium]